MQLIRKKGIFLGLLATILILLGSTATIPQTKPVLGQDSPQIYISTKTGTFRSGGLIALSSAEEPTVNIRSYNASGQADIFLYQTDEEALIRNLLRDKDNNQINKKVDTSKLQLIASQQAFVNSSGETKVTLPLSQSGIWLLRISLSGTTVDNFIIRSDNGVLVKEGNQEYIFWAQNFRTKKSAQSGTLKLYSLLNKQTELASTNFSNEGIAKTSLLPDADIGVAKFGSDEVVFPINLHYLNSSYDYRPLKSLKETKYFIFTDRPIYKPGDTLYFKAILRDDDDALYSIPKGVAKVRVYKDPDEPLVSKDFPISEEGTVSGEYKISPDSPTGYFFLEVKLPSDEDKYTYDSLVEFQVEYFRKPEYSMTLATDKTELIASDKSSAKLSAEYFFGQPVVNQKVKYVIKTSNFYEYQFQTDSTLLKDDYQYGYGGGEKVIGAEVILDKKGQALINFDARIPPDKNPTNDTYYQPRLGHNQVFTIEALLDDGSGNTAYARKNILVYAGEFDIFRKDRSYSAKVGDQINLPLILVPHFKSQISGINLTADIRRENWISYQESDKKYLSYKKEEEDLPSIKTTSDKDGNAIFTFTPQKVGSYKLKVSGNDRRGNLVSKNFYIYVTSERDYYNFKGSGSQITISSDKDLYLPKDTAKLTIFSQIPDTDVFLSLERGRLHRFQVIHLKGNSTFVDLPLKDSDIPNIHAQASIFSNDSLEQGSANLIVSADSKKLKVAITTDQKKYGPGDTVQVDIQTTDINGQPISADTALWAVDKALYELSDAKPPDIFEAFWSSRYDSTAQSHSLLGIKAFEGGGGGCFAADTQVLMRDGKVKRIDQVKKDDLLVSGKVLGVHKSKVDGYLIINGHLKVTTNHKIFVNKSWMQAGSIQIGDTLTDPSGRQIPVTSLEWQKGEFSVYNLEVDGNHTFFANSVLVHNQKGGGARAIFKDTAYWNPSVHTDNLGHAKVSFQLPDNLTTWVLSAIGTTPQTQVGQKTAEIVVQKDVFIRPILPNILRVGDQAILSAIVHNFTDHDQDLEIKLESDFVKVEANQKQRVKISASEGKQIYWPVTTPTEQEKSKLTFSVFSKKENQLLDSATLEIPIRPFGFFEKQISVGQGNVSFPIQLSAATDKLKTKITLDFSPTILGPAFSAMKYLINYPYGCVEQITSRLTPALYAKLNPQLFSDALEGKNVDKIIKDGLKSLSTLQHSDGGFSWWQSGQSNHFVTSFVVENLIISKNLGYIVSDELLKSAKSFLQTETFYNYQTNQPQPLTESQQIARLYALSLLNLPKDKSQIYVTNLQVLPDILSLAVLTNIQNGYKDPDTNGLNKLLSLAKTQGDTQFFESGAKENFGSVEASTALAIRAMIAAGIDTNQITPYVRFLVNGRRADYFGNTFASSQVVKVLTDFAKVSKEETPNYTYTVSLDNTQLTKGQFSSIETPLQKVVIPKDDIKSPSTLIVKQQGQGQLYSTLEVEEFNIDKNAKAKNLGFYIKREYLTEKGNKITLGDTVTIKLTVSGLEAKDYYAVIKDELPAGLIPINTSFKNEQYYLFDEPPQPIPTPSPFEATDTEVTENGMILSLYQIDKGTHVYTYKARAVTQGTFQAPPAQVELMYNPKVYGRSDVDTVQIEGISKLEQTRFGIVKFIQNNKIVIALVIIAVFALPAGFVIYRRLFKNSP